MLIGPVRVVAKVQAGVLAWEPGEDQSRLYYVVEAAALWRIAGVTMENSLLKLEIERLKAQLREKKGPGA